MPTLIRRLIAEDRLAIGPWQILLDEFLVSGETIVRNLELGWDRAEELGHAMRVGLPRTCSGTSPRCPVARRAGIDRAVVWRGVPALIDHHRFVWHAPDGSAVETEYLVGGLRQRACLRRSRGAGGPAARWLSRRVRRLLRRAVAAGDVRRRTTPSSPRSWPPGGAGERGAWSGRGAPRDPGADYLDAGDRPSAVSEAVWTGKLVRRTRQHVDERHLRAGRPQARRRPRRAATRALRRAARRAPWRPGGLAGPPPRARLAEENSAHDYHLRLLARPGRGPGDDPGGRADRGP